MATTYIIGNDGYVTLGDPVKGIQVKQWAANATRVSSDVTGFGDAARRRRAGLFDITGSLSGTPVCGTTTGVISFTSVQTSNATMSLGLYTGGDTNVTTDDVFITVNPIFESFAFTSAKEGDAGVQISWQNANGALPTVGWVVT